MNYQKNHWFIFIFYLLVNILDNILDRYIYYIIKIT